MKQSEAFKTIPNETATARPDLKLVPQEKDELSSGAKHNLEIYEGIPAGHYHQAMISGQPIQRAWHHHKFQKVINHIQPQWDILDIGCGPGSLLSLLPPRTGRTVGVDLAPKQIEFAKNTFASRGFEWKVGGFPNLPFPDESFDCILMVELIEHLNPYDMAQYFREVRRKLRPGGKIIITTPNYLSFWPAVEWLLGKVSPIAYEEQHIARFTIGRMEMLLGYLEFPNYKIQTFFVMAPFLANFGDSIVRKAMAIEETALPNFGQLLLVEIQI